MIESGLRSHRTRRCRVVTYLESYITKHTTYTSKCHLPRVEEKWMLQMGSDFSRDALGHCSMPGPFRNRRRLPGKGNSTSHRARPVHRITTMIERIRTCRLTIKNSLPLRHSTLDLDLGGQRTLRAAQRAKRTVPADGGMDVSVFVRDALGHCSMPGPLRTR